MDSLSCPAGTGMWRIKMKIKKPSHIIKGGGFRVSKIIALVTVTDLGRGGAAGGVDGAAFGTYRGSQGHCGGENLAVVLCGLVVSVRYMLLFVGTNSGGGSLW